MTFSPINKITCKKCIALLQINKSCFIACQYFTRKFDSSSTYLKLPELKPSSFWHCEQLQNEYWEYSDVNSLAVSLLGFLLLSRVKVRVFEVTIIAHVRCRKNNTLLLLSAVPPCSN